MKHYNSSITEDVNLKFNPKGEFITNEVLDVITPTIELKPRINIVRTSGASNSTSQTIYTTPTDKDFYLTSACLSVCKDVTSTSALSSLRCTIDGLNSAVLNISGITLTVQQSVASISFPYPIKIDRGTNITVTASTNVANIRIDGSITGYTQETVKAV